MVVCCGKHQSGAPWRAPLGAAWRASSTTPWRAVLGAPWRDSQSVASLVSGALVHWCLVHWCTGVWCTGALVQLPAKYYSKFHLGSQLILWVFSGSFTRFKFELFSRPKESKHLNDFKCKNQCGLTSFETK